MNSPQCRHFRLLATKRARPHRSLRSAALDNPAELVAVVLAAVVVLSAAVAVEPVGALLLLYHSRTILHFLILALVRFYLWPPY